MCCPVSAPRVLPVNAGATEGAGEVLRLVYYQLARAWNCTADSQRPRTQPGAPRYEAGPKYHHGKVFSPLAHRALHWTESYAVEIGNRTT